MVMRGRIKFDVLCRYVSLHVLIDPAQLQIFQSTMIGKEVVQDRVGKDVEWILLSCWVIPHKARPETCAAIFARMGITGGDARPRVFVNRL